MTDQSGALVPKATVTITNVATGQTKETTSDDTGYFSILNVLEGTYDLTVNASGFRPYVERGVRISINTVTRVNVALQVGAVTQSVTVEASAALLQTTKADVSVSLESRAMENLPLSNYRNYQTLINLVPGATPGRFQNAITDTPGRALSHNINGQQRGANNTRLDGSADILVTMPHHEVYVPPVESIETVNVSTNSFDAEQGMTGGAAITVLTKSGTNSFHGSLFAFHDNSALRAFLWDENRVGLRKKPKGIRNIDGGSIGGPIRKNKLFYFADWEGTFERLNRNRLSSVPRDDLRTGDFTRIFGATTPMIFDPYTGSEDGTGRTPFSYLGKLNVIPPGRLNGPMMKLLALVPRPNQPGDTFNYFTSGVLRMNRNNLDGKVNWNRNEKHQLWFKYSVMDALVHGDFSLGKAGGQCVCDGGIGDGHTLTQIAAIGQTYTVSPNFLIDATLGWTRFGQNVKPPDLGTNFGSEVLGIPGTNGPDPRESGLPWFEISGFSTLGNPEEWNPLFRNDQSYTFNANASWMKGAHDIRFGFDFVHHLMNHWQPELGRGPRGAFTFDTDVTSNSDIGGGDEFNALAAFLIGAPQSSGKSSQYIKMDSLENQYALYIRDRWRATPKLTLNLGLRWELYPNRRRSQGLGIESYDPTTNEALIGGRGGIPRDNGVGWSKKLFAPRIGFAYQLTPTTVIRGGYGITYHSHPWGAQALRGWFPLTVVAEFAGVNGFQPVTTDPSYVAAGVPNAPLGPAVGIPSILGFDITKGRVKLPEAAETGYPEANKLMRRGYIQSWNFIIEHRLPGDLVTSIGYVGSASIRDLAFRNINASQIPGSGNNGRPIFPKFGRTADTRLWDGMLNGNYHSLQVSLNRRFTGGLLLKGAYTYSRAINMANYSDWTETLWPANIVWNRNRAPADYNIPHILQFAYVYELPFGSGKKWAAGGTSRAVLGGWQLNGIFSSFQGRQFTLSAPGGSLKMPGNRQTPDQIKPTVEKIGCVGSDPGCFFFDPTAFRRVDKDPNPKNRVRFGTVGRNTMRGPGVVNMDLSLFRTFKLTEKFNLQFRAEAFNLSNTPHFAFPIGSASNRRFGQITSTDSGNSRLALGRSREMRFGLRLGF